MQQKNALLHNFSARLEALRKERGITQPQLALRTGVSQSSISRYCGGQTEPKVTDFCALASFFGVTMEWLLTGEGPREAQRSSPQRSPCPRCDAAEARAATAESELAVLKERISRLLGQ